MCASSSIALSMENTLVCAPSERIAEVCKGIVGEKLFITWMFGST